mgnify:FL=1
MKPLHVALAAVVALIALVLIASSIGIIHIRL